MKDYNRFFRRLEDCRFETRFYENGESFEVEELYQAFKARAYDELKNQIISDVQDMNKRDLYLLKHGYEVGYLNASLKAANGGEPLADSPEVEAEEWSKEVIADNGGTTAQYICHQAPKAT